MTDNEKKLYHYVAQPAISGMPFSVRESTVEPIWITWDATARRQMMGKFKDKKFLKWDTTTKTWVEIPYDGKIWRKQYPRIIDFDSAKNLEVYDKEQKKKIIKPLTTVNIYFSATVEKQLQLKMEEEKKRGNNPMNQYFVITLTKGATPLQNTYTVGYEKDKVSNKPVDGFKLNLGGVENPDKAKIEALLNALKSQTNSLSVEQLHSFKSQIISQVEEQLATQQIKTITAEEVFNRLIKR